MLVDEEWLLDDFPSPPRKKFSRVGFHVDDEAPEADLWAAQSFEVKFS
jgi:hypothetical protein